MRCPFELFSDFRSELSSFGCAPEPLQAPFSLRSSRGCAVGPDAPLPAPWDAPLHTAGRRRSPMTMSYFRGARRQPAPPPAPAASGNTLSHHPSFMPGCSVYTPGSACVPPATHTAINTRAPGACLVPRPAERVAAEAAEAAATGISMCGLAVGLRLPMLACCARVHILLASRSSLSFPPPCPAHHRYKAAFQTDPAHDWAALPRARPPAVDAAPTGTARVVEADRLPPSTYQDELLRRRGAGQQPSGSAGSFSGSASAPTSPAALRGPMMTVRPGYLTTAAAAQLPIAEKYAAAAPLSAGNSPLVAQRSSCSFSAGGSSLSPGGRPASVATAGSGAACCFKDSALAAVPAVRPASGSSRSPGQPPVRKEDAFLYSLDQHSRGRLPGCTLHKPRHNVSLELPPPSKLTEWGAASQAALRRWRDGSKLAVCGSGVSSGACHGMEHLSRQGQAATDGRRTLASCPHTFPIFSTNPRCSSIHHPSAGQCRRQTAHMRLTAARVCWASSPRVHQTTCRTKGWPRWVGPASLGSGFFQSTKASTCA